MDKNDEDLTFFVEELRNSGIEATIHLIDNSILDKIDYRIQAKINAIKEISKNLNCSIGIVGGFVRDLLLENPSQDVDFIILKGDMQDLTQAISKEMEGKVGKMSNQTLTTQIRFPDGTVFEFNETRKEEYEYPSRVPKVEKASLLEDLSRRDFTINTFVLFGNKYIDVFDGKKDLENRLLQTTREPSIVFNEDYLRMIRAIRFASKLDFTITDQVIDGIKKHADNLAEVPHERILNELKISFGFDPTKTFNLMKHLGILVALFPEIPDIDLEKNEFHSSSSWEKIASKFEYLKERNIKDSSVLLSVIFMELQVEDSFLYNEKRLELIRVEEIKRLLKRFTFSNKEINEITLYVKYKDSIENLLDFQSSTLEMRLFLRSVDPFLENLIHLTLAENSTKRNPIELFSFVGKLREMNSKKELVHVVPKLDGNEIEKHFGFKDREIGEIKLILTVAIMKEEIPNTKEACIEYIKRKLV
ncbi:MAG: CCA tRNA nucleotidyltransferase [Asgard group archaeon]|nr:CCA tRNA nucleotidyltransferase [Asgard group archaeon]